MSNARDEALDLLHAGLQRKAAELIADLERAEAEVRAERAMRKIMTDLEEYVRNVEGR